jgi:hypothetical protein
MSAFGVPMGVPTMLAVHHSALSIIVHPICEVDYVDILILHPQPRVRAVCTDHRRCSHNAQLHMLGQQDGATVRQSYFGGIVVALLKDV